MGLRIQSNIAALNAHRHLSNTDNALSKSLERLSSGFRVNRAADDAAGLAVSEGLRADIKSYQVATRNTSEAGSLLQVAEGAMDQIGNMLTRLKELATQAASDNTSSSNRTKLNSEATQLKNEIDRIADSTNYGGTKLIDGSFNGASSVSSTDTADIAGISDIYSFDVTSASSGTYSMGYTVASDLLTVTKGGVSQSITLTKGGTVNFSTFNISFKLTSAATLDTVGAAFTGIDTASATGLLDVTAGSGSTFQVGAGNSTDDQITFSIGDGNTAALGLGASSYVTNIDLTTSANAQLAIDIVDDAIDDVALIRGQVGAVQNRLSYASANLATTIENVTAADSIIRDADMAAEMTTFTKNQILLQAGTAMLAQANSAPQVLLSLLK